MTSISSNPASIAMFKAMQMDNGAAARAAQEAKKSTDTSKVEEAATDFEATYIAEMMKPMFEGISSEAPFGGGKGEEVFRGMMLQEYGKIIARTGSIGLADSIKTEMIKMQEQADNAK